MVPADFVPASSSTGAMPIRERLHWQVTAPCATRHRISQDSERRRTQIANSSCAQLPWSLPLLVCASLMTSSLAARAEQSCAPKTNAAKILRTKNVNDVDPNWAPPSFIGTSWSLIETRQEGIFLSGVLVNPRGNALPGRVFVIASEWDCG